MFRENVLVREDIIDRFPRHAVESILADTAFRSEVAPQAQALWIDELVSALSALAP